MNENEIDTSKETKCGYAAVIGRPNVGKSTLLNKILGEKLSIVTAKPQTTRNRILAVYNSGPVQVIFLDTPGIHRPQGSLGQYMVDAAEAAMHEAEVCVWLIDVADSSRKRGLTRAEHEIAEQVRRIGCPAIVLLNKIDRLKDKTGMLPLMEAASSIPNVEEVIPVSALNGEGDRKSVV